MSPLTAADDHIAQARQLDGLYPTLPWSSFADFFKSRIYGSLSWPIDRFSSTTTVTGNATVRTATPSSVQWSNGQSPSSMTRSGSGAGTVWRSILFNHDITVVLYFAAWSSGITVVLINVDEPTEKMRFILEHSEASAVCCWQSYVGKSERSSARSGPPYGMWLW